MQRLLKVLLMMLALCLLMVGMTLVVLPAKEVGFQEKQHSLRRTNIRKKMLVGGTGKQRFVFEDAEFPRRALRHKEHISPPPPALNARGSFGGFVPSPPSSPP